MAYVRRVLCSAAVFFYFFIFIDFCQTSYLKIYRTDLRQMVGRTMAVLYIDDQSEIYSFLIPQETLPWQPIFVGFSLYPQN